MTYTLRELRPIAFSIRMRCYQYCLGTLAKWISPEKMGRCCCNGPSYGRRFESWRKDNAARRTFKAVPTMMIFSTVLSVELEGERLGTLSS